jgi:hypothetical protein
MIGSMTVQSLITTFYLVLVGSSAPRVLPRRFSGVNADESVRTSMQQPPHHRRIVPVATSRHRHTSEAAQRTGRRFPG